MAGKIEKDVPEVSRKEVGKARIPGRGFKKTHVKTPVIVA